MRIGHSAWPGLRPSAEGAARGGLEESAGRNHSGEGGAVVRAVVMREFGPPQVLEPAEVAEPEPGPDEVVIDVELASVTFVETQVRAGQPPHPSMLPALPAIGECASTSRM